MKIYDLLKKINKYSYEKSDVYKFIEQHKNLLDDYHVHYKLKNMIDCFYLEILVKSLINKWTIDEAYNKFFSEYHDTFAYMNYQEKRKMFNNDLEPILETLPYFLYQDKKIYIPHMNEYMNSWYREDYSIVLLRQHKLEIEKIIISPTIAFELYGDLFQSQFSSLKYIYEDDKQVYYFYDELKSIYIFDKEIKGFSDYFYIQEKKYEKDLDADSLKFICEMFSQKKYQEVLDEMYKKENISEKLYKKLSKKIKKG